MVVGCLLVLFKVIDGALVFFWFLFLFSGGDGVLFWQVSNQFCVEQSVFVQCFVAGLVIFARF